MPPGCNVRRRTPKPEVFPTRSKALFVPSQEEWKVPFGTFRPVCSGCGAKQAILGRTRRSQTS